jgi:hypothetical protein
MQGWIRRENSFAYFARMRSEIIVYGFEVLHGFLRRGSVWLNRSLALAALAALGNRRREYRADCSGREKDGKEQVR